MGILNNPLGMNETNHDPINDNPYNEGVSTGYIVPPPPGIYMITENGLFMQTEIGNNLMIVE
jgi:hypothetical protein